MDNTNDKTAVQMPKPVCRIELDQHDEWRVSEFEDQGYPVFREEGLEAYAKAVGDARAEEARREAAQEISELEETCRYITAEKMELRAQLAQRPPAASAAVPGADATPLFWLSSQQVYGLDQITGVYLPFQRERGGNFDFPVFDRQLVAEVAAQADARTWASDGGLRCLNCGKGLSAHEYQRNCPPVAEAAAQADGFDISWVRIQQKCLNDLAGKLLNTPECFRSAPVFDLVQHGEMLASLSKSIDECIEAIAAPTAAAAAQVDGVWLPKEPTPEIVQAMKDAWWTGQSSLVMKTTDAYRVYFAALAAAPTAQPTHRPAADAGRNEAPPTPKENAPDLEGRGVELQAPVGTSAKIEASVAQPTPLDDERAAFEKWAIGKLLVSEYFMAFDKGKYVNNFVEGAWLSWQEATRRAALRHPGALPDAARDVLAERQRQISAEGWTVEHDDDHADGQMAVAAGYYALACGYPHERDIGRGHVPTYWPWAPSWWKPRDKRSNLIKSGALILAEIERLDRAALAAKQAGKEAP